MHGAKKEVIKERKYTETENRWTREIRQTVLAGVKSI